MRNERDPIPYPRLECDATLSGSKPQIILDKSKSQCPKEILEKKQKLFRSQKSQPWNRLALEQTHASVRHRVDFTNKNDQPPKWKYYDPNDIRPAPTVNIDPSLFEDNKLAGFRTGLCRETTLICERSPFFLPTFTRWKMFNFRNDSTPWNLDRWVLDLSIYRDFTVNLNLK